MPRAAVRVLAGASMSEIQSIQAVSRATRPHGAREEAGAYFFADDITDAGESAWLDAVDACAGRARTVQTVGTAWKFSPRVARTRDFVESTPGIRWATESRCAFL